MPWWPSIQRRIRIGIRWRIVKRLLRNCPEMRVFGTHRQARHSMVSEQTCTSSHQTDRSFWQTPGSFDFWYTPHEWFWSNIVMWEILYNSAELGLSEDSDFAGDLEDSKIDFRENFLHIWKSHVRATKFDMQGTNVSFTQFNGIWNYFSWGPRMDGTPALDLWDLVIEVFHSSSNQFKKPKVTCCVTHHQASTPTSKPRIQFIRAILGVRWRLCFLKREVFSFWCDALHLRRQWSSNQDDHWRQKSNNETCIQNPQSCTRVVMWQNQSGS